MTTTTEQNATEILLKRLDEMKAAQDHTDLSSDYADFAKHAKALATNGDISTVDMPKFAAWLQSSFTSLFALLLRISSEKINLPESDLAFLKSFLSYLINHAVEWDRVAKHFIDTIDMDIYNAVNPEEDDDLYEFEDCEKIYENWHNNMREMISSVTKKA